MPLLQDPCLFLDPALDSETPTAQAALYNCFLLPGGNPMFCTARPGVSLEMSMGRSREGWRETWAYLEVPKEPMISSWASCQRWVYLWIDTVPFTLCLQLVKRLEHGRDYDLNPAVLRGLEASEGAKCSGELPKRIKPESRLQAHLMSQPKSMG